MRDFKSKTALITGAGNGFCAEFADEAARRGMKCFIADIDRKDLERTKATLAHARAEVAACVADLSLESEVDRMVTEAMAAYGRIDLPFLLS